ncbi:CBS domain-containing protein [Lyngbya confervoides]|uniref:CBS domain-containing protein n=1 Tax=Lyngbya confervoides BDU141951 TaxID=1574623 RepID=A0ABD4T7U1_9CYAN|nr:CBS domain-containing protein [Lyngbya confervoides]MCM1984652.1 CBS domain-containing protein [Lyngbya confervoides BDU141951]
MLRARDLMTENVLSIHSSVTVAQAIALMQMENVRSLIVICPEDSSSLGIITERDIAYHIIAPQVDPETVLVRDIMRKPCICATPELTLSEIAQIFAETGIQRAPVIEGDELLGIISTTDLLMKLEVGQQQPVDPLSRRIQEALRHARVLQNPEERMAQETEIAWNVVEAMAQETAAPTPGDWMES